VALPEAIELAARLATTPGFDCLFDPSPATPVIEPYHDPVGYPTQGYGRLLSRVKWEDLSKYPAVSKDQAWEELVEDVLSANRSVRRLCPVPLTVYQEAALTDFAFNCGGGNLQISALRQAVLRGDHEAASNQFSRWVYASGVRLNGLIKRRAAERALYLTKENT
jgi:lysozyme